MLVNESTCHLHFVLHSGRQPPFLSIASPFPRKVIWWPNDFPYFVEPGIEHHVIWVSGFADAPLETHPEIVAELERQRPAGSWEVLFWENPTELRSIPEVRHVQVLSRPRRPAPRL